MSKNYVSWLTDTILYINYCYIVIKIRSVYLIVPFFLFIIFYFLFLHNANAVPGTAVYMGTSTNLSGQVIGGSFVDYQNNSYFLDPAASGNSLLVAGSVGIGTTSPASILNIVNTTSSSPRGILGDQYSGDASGPRLELRKSRGTPGSPTAILSGDTVGSIAMSGYDGSSFANSAFLTTSATENWSSTAHGTSMTLWNTPTGSTSYTQRITIDQAGNVGIGTTNPGQKLSVVGTIESTTGGFKFPDGTTQASAGSIPSGAVMFFNLAACPTGWTELTSARGRYVVGTPNGGTNGGTDGTALTNLEDRPVGQHSHTITDPGHSHNLTVSNGGCCNGAEIAVTQENNNGTQTFASKAQTRTTGITINNAGSVAGTNAPYIQLLICQKS